MKKLYYVVEKQLQDVEVVEETTGWKTITVYTIEKEELKKWFDLEINNEKNNQEAIIGYIYDNDLNINEIKLIEL